MQTDRWDVGESRLRSRESSLSDVGERCVFFPELQIIVKAPMMNYLVHFKTRR